MWKYVIYVNISEKHHLTFSVEKQMKAGLYSSAPYLVFKLDLKGRDAILFYSSTLNDGSNLLKIEKNWLKENIFQC